jgi:hypothetical protein
MKRLSFYIAADLHRRIRISFVERGINMTENLLRILLEHFSAQMRRCDERCYRSPLDCK